MTTATGTVGRITQVIGSTFDAAFPEDALPVFEREMAAEGADWWKIGRVVPAGAQPLALR